MIFKIYIEIEKSYILKKVKIDILYQIKIILIIITILNLINIKLNCQNVYVYCQFEDIAIFGNNIVYI
jgi:hypothetical protein